MNEHVQLIVDENRAEITTKGHSARSEQGELRVRVDGAGRLNQLRDFVRYLVTYVENTGSVLRPDETLAYGSWLVKFVPARGGILDVHELDANCSAYLPGVNRAVDLWSRQSNVCTAYGMSFEPPGPHRMVAVAPTVLDGSRTVLGVRYPGPEHMSGWYLMEGDCSDVGPEGRLTEMRTEHVCHVVARCPLVAHLLALPEGWRFEVDAGTGQGRERAWFDRDVMEGD